MDITDCPASCYEALIALLLFPRVKSVVYTLYGPDTESKLKVLTKDEQNSCAVLYWLSVVWQGTILALGTQS